MEETLKEIGEFALKHWEQIASVILFVAAFVIGCVRSKKKGYTFIEVMTGILTEQAPEWIRAAEAKGGTGEQKKVSVLNAAVSCATKAMGRALTESEVNAIVTKMSQIIEDVLDTPQKKESEGKNKCLK